jgi:antitoxin MazE
VARIVTVALCANTRFAPISLRERAVGACCRPGLDLHYRSTNGAVQLISKESAMRARVAKWGNSLAIRLPQAAVKSLQVHEGEQVELSIKGDRLEIRAARPRYRLADLLAGITPDHQPEILDVPPVGSEAL